MIVGVQKQYPKANQSVLQKAKYGVFAAIIIIVIVNAIYYKDFLLSLIK